MGNFADFFERKNHGLPTLFRPAQARALAVDRREEGQHVAHCSEIGAIPNRQAAFSICEHSLTYTCERRNFSTQPATKMIAKDYRHDDQARKDRKALLRALKPFGYAALAGTLFGVLLALLTLF